MADKKLVANSVIGAGLGLTWFCALFVLSVPMLQKWHFCVAVSDDCSQMIFVQDLVWP